MNDFTLTAHIVGDFASTLTRVRSALSEQGFGVITEIDMQATLKAKLDIDIPEQVILGACRPELAHQALQANPSIAAMLPCNVVVRMDNADSTVVEAFDPAFMAALADDEAVTRVAADAGRRLRAMLKTLSEEK